MAYVIKGLTAVNENENTDIQSLVELCNKFDKTHYSYFADTCFKEADDINTFLLYDKNKLISAISLFTPRSCEAEVLAYTHPDFRRQGLFTILLAEAAVEMKKRNIPDFLFVCDKKAVTSQMVMELIGAKYEYSEYSMSLDAKKFTPAENRPDVEIRPVQAADKSELARINSEAFHESIEESENFIEEFFTGGRRLFHTVLYNGKIAGMIGVYVEDVRYYIHGVCVDKSLRGKGIGRQALSFAVEKFSKVNPLMAINLDVHAENEGALGLYLNAGFEIVSALDYLRLPIK